MAAVLTNDRFRLEISIADYEFQDGVSDPFDANWLVVRVTLTMIHGAWRWQVEDAAALTWELQECIRWLLDVSAGRATGATSFSFSEPDIRLEVLRDADNAVAGLAVHLMDEFQPPVKVLYPRENNIATLRFSASAESLQTFARALQAEGERFPPRGERPPLTPV